MGITRAYQLFLLIFFLGISASVYYFQFDKFKSITKAQHQEYQTFITPFTHWDDSAQALYQQINQEHPLAFFQYTHEIDGRKNFTRGQIAPQTPKLEDKLFPIELKSTHSLPQARLLTLVDTSKLKSDAFNQLTKQLSLIWLIYFTLAFMFWLLSYRHRKGIHYVANYITKLGNLDFSAIENSKINGEFKPINKALSNCKTALKQKLELIENENDKLTDLAYKDPVTEFATRQPFTQKLDNIAKQDKGQFGVMVSIKATELGQINQLQGKQAGDQYLIRIVECIRNALQGLNDNECFRVSGSDFSIFLANIALNDAEDFAKQLKKQFDKYQSQLKSDSIAYIGITPYQAGADPVELINLSETAVSIAQTLGPNSYHMLEKLDDNTLFGDERWRIAIEDILQRRAIKFYQQVIQPCSRETKLYNELFSRFYNAEGKILPTSTVIAMAERHGLVNELDKLVILSVVNMLRHTPNFEGNLGINISTVSAHQEEFVAWLKSLLTKERNAAAKIIFEVNEAGMQSNLNASYIFVRAMHSVGAKVSIEHFGMGFTSFKFFRQVRPDFIKLDASYTDTITEDIDNKFFVRMVVDIAKRLSIKVIATSVERQEEKLTLEKLLINGLQGYYISKPKPLGKS